MKLRAWLCLLLALSLLALPRGAHAHDPFEITATGRVRATSLELELTMTRAAALRLAAARGTDPNDLAALCPRLYRATIAEKPLAMRWGSVERSDEKEVVYRLAYEGFATGSLRLEASHVVALADGYTSTLALFQDEPPRSLGFRVLTAADPAFDVELGASPSAGPAPSAAPRARSSGIFASFFRLGLEHILEGYDHLLFLAGLLIAASSVRSAMLLVSAFTVAHSLTLGLSVLGWIAAPPALVEWIVAASIVVVGLENLWLKEAPRHRAALVFAFGLVHGLGFAGALQEAAQGAESRALLAQLLGFNLGVEAGQLGLGLVALPLLLEAKKQRFGPGVLAAASILVSLTGAYLLAARSALS